MLARLFALLVAIAIAVPTARADNNDADAETKRKAQRDALTTEEWQEPRVPADPLWHLLAFPERVVELAFMPLHGLVVVAERYRLDKRIRELFSFGPVSVSPRVRLSFGDGFGGGARIKIDPLGRETSRLDVAGLARLDGDNQQSVRYRYAFARLEGRTLLLQVERERDRNDPYYGLGNDTVEADERAVKSERIESTATLDLSRGGEVGLTGLVTVGHRHETLSPGEDDNALPANPSDMVGVPTGFGRTLDFLSLSLAGRRDTRDTVGRPTRGVVGEMQVTFAAATQDVEINGLSARAQVRGFWSPLPDNRTFVFTLGMAAATSISSVGQVPFHLLPALGRRTFLRGFRRDRFRDHGAYWAGLEYRYPVYEYKTTRVALEPKLFLDVARVGGTVDDLLSGSPHWSAGGGFRIAHETVVGFDLTLGYSTEGFSFNFQLGRSL